MMNQKGFSLIEMVIVVAIIAVVSFFGIPSVQSWIIDQRLKHDVTRLDGDLQIARITAINRNVGVTVRFTLPNSYIVFIDDGTGGGTARNLVRDGTEELIVQRTLDTGITFTSVDFAGGKAVLFNGKGLRGIPSVGNAVARIIVQNPRVKQYQMDITFVGDTNVSAL
jgi:prepilin-type N-terminal cleavage/methylation domain-containing protein